MAFYRHIRNKTNIIQLAPRLQPSPLISQPNKKKEIYVRLESFITVHNIFCSGVTEYDYQLLDYWPDRMSNNDFFGKGKKDSFLGSQTNKNDPAARIITSSEAALIRGERTTGNYQRC